MRTLLLLAALLAGSLSVFLFRGMGALAERDQAHVDLLKREKDLDALLRQYGTTDDTAFAALLDEHARLTALARQRREILSAPTPGLPAPPRLDALLRASPCEALRPGGALHAAVRAQAGLPAESGQPPAAPTLREQALARIVEALGAAGGSLALDTLELRGGGQPVPVLDVPELQSIEAQLVVSGALPDVLMVLELLAPSDGGGLPAVTVRDAALRRVDPSRWGEDIHLLATPPLRLTASLIVLLEAPGGT